jgi:hypothetical protein
MGTWDGSNDISVDPSHFISDLKIPLNWRFLNGKTIHIFLTKMDILYREICLYLCMDIKIKCRLTTYFQYLKITCIPVLPHSILNSKRTSVKLGHNILFSYDNVRSDIRYKYFSLLMQTSFWLTLSYWPRKNFARTLQQCAEWKKSMITFVTKQSP